MKGWGEINRWRGLSSQARLRRMTCLGPTSAGSDPCGH